MTRLGKPLLSEIFGLTVCGNVVWEGEQPWSGIRRSTDRLFWSKPEIQKPVGSLVSFQEAACFRTGVWL